MVIHSDFQKVLQSLTKIYGEQGKQLFDSIVEERKWNISNPFPWGEHKGGFGWTGDLPQLDGDLVRGHAIHPIKTYHPNEFPNVRVYLEEELRTSAPNLEGKPLLLNHWFPLPPPNKVVMTRYDDGALTYVGTVDEHVKKAIQDGEIKQVSVDFNWKSLEKMNGVAPRGIDYNGLSLLDSTVVAGDPQAYIELWEGVVQRLKEMKERGEEKAFADYSSMEDCIAKNPDKDNPAAYCAEICRQVTEFVEKMDVLGIDPEKAREIWLVAEAVRGPGITVKEKTPTKEMTWLYFPSSEDAKEAVEELKGQGIYPDGFAGNVLTFLSDGDAQRAHELVGGEIIKESIERTSALRQQVATLQENSRILNSSLTAERGKVEALEASHGNFITRMEAIIPAQIPGHWGMGARRVIRRLRELVKETPAKVGG